MANAKSKELVPRRYNRGMILLTIQKLSAARESAQPQLCDLAECIENNDVPLLEILIGKLDPYNNRSCNLLIDYATIVAKYDRPVAELAFLRLCDMKDWRERKVIWRKIIVGRAVQDKVWYDAIASLQHLEEKFVDLMEFRAAKAQKK